MTALRVLLLLLCLVAREAHADSAGEANTRFLWGRELYQKGKYREALDQFLVSNRLSPNPAPALGIARCFAILDLPHEAFNAYAEYLAHPLAPADAELARKEQEALAPRIARLDVKSEPSGATIYLDRKNLGAMGVTPRTCATTPGEHTLIIELEGYDPVERKVTIEKGAHLELAIVMSKKTGRVHVATKPPGAEIRVDGDLVATTPAELTIPIGAHQLHLALAGHEPERQTILVEPDRNLPLELDLRALPPPQGRLRVETNVVDALVTLNGSEVGYSPFVAEPTAGTYLVTIQKPGYLSFSAEVRVHAEETAAVEAMLQPIVEEGGVGPLPWIILAATGASAIATGVLGTQALAASAAFEDSESATRAQYDRVGRLNGATDVMLGVTIAGVLGTLAAFLLTDGVEQLESSGRVINPEPAR